MGNTSYVASDSAGPKEWNIRPKISVGVGVLNYQGDLIASRGYFNPFQNRPSLHINAGQSINDFLDINFFMLFGTLSADERTLVRNLNFKSKVTAGGVALSYNFSQFLKPTHILEPFVSVGFEVFEFQTKTDLIDAYGNTYNYWSDGTIRNMSQQDPESGLAQEITRDYVYETDVRNRNQDGFGNYPERSYAIPVGWGATMLMGNQMSFSIGMEYHWTFTDYIDGITPDSRAVRQGSKGTDKFLHTFIRLTYDLTPVPHEEIPDFSGGDKADSDLDSIPDFLDDCPNTPIGVPVDKKGCPIDSDGDGVPDYADAELNSSAGSIVDSSGVAFTDADFEQMYLEWTDESGAHSQYTNNSYSIETAERKTKRRKTQYSVEIGEFSEGVDDSLANVLLSMPEVTTRQTSDGKTIIEMKGFDNLPDAIQKRIELESSGIATNNVNETNASGSKSRITSVEQDMVTKKQIGITVEEAIAKNKALPVPKKLILYKSQYTLDRPIDSRSVAVVDDSHFGDKAVYRVQVGAFANKISDDVFNGMKDLVVITSSDGLTRYYVGAASSYEQAAARKIDMIEKGFTGAHVVPFNNGQRASLESIGATRAKNIVPLAPESSKNFGKVKFKVQIGAFTGQLPTDMLDKMMGLGRMDQREGEAGTTRYFAGEFNNYEDAESYKRDLISQGFGDAFIAAEYQGTIISANEGIKLLK
jgi:hypothetical protein